jgi:hypothetical protein
VQSQIERAKSFYSQHSLALASSSQEERGRCPEQRQQQQQQPQHLPPPQQQHSVQLNLGCTDSSFCAELETPDGVKSMPV